MAAISPSLNEQTIAPALDALTPREAQVIKMRFGLEDYDAHTLEQIGQSLSITRERVRQIEVKALGKLRLACMS